MENNDYSSNNIACFLAGALVGATAALLMAPQTGRRTRRMLREKVEDGVESVVDAGHGLRQQGKKLAEGAEGLVDRATNVISALGS